MMVNPIIAMIERDFSIRCLRVKNEKRNDGKNFYLWEGGIRPIVEEMVVKKVKIVVLVMGEIGWGLSLLVLLTLTIYFIRSLKASWTLRFLGLVALAGALNVLGLYLSFIWGQAVVAGFRCISIARAALPFFTLLFALYYPNPHPLTRRPWILPLLAVPPVITAIMTDPMLMSDFQARPVLPYLILWMVPYFLGAYVLLLNSLKKMKLPIIRWQIIYLTVGIIVATGSHLSTSIILVALGNDRFWWYNSYWVILAGAIMTWGFIRHDIFRWQTRSRNRLEDQQIVAMGDGARVLAHIMKNHLTVIDYLASQAEQGMTEKLQAIRTTCQDVCRRLNEVGETPPIDPQPGEIIAGEQLFVDAFSVVVPDGQRIIRSIELPLPFVKGSREQLRMAFRHLIANASESMKDGGEIRIEAQQEGDYLVVRIADQGVGIAKERLQNIFKPFNTSKSLYESWGLGLSFVHQVLAAHRGGLLVESIPERGTAFIVFLPICNGANRADFSCNDNCICDGESMKGI